MRELYLKLLEELNNSLILMGSLIENAIESSVKALELQDTSYCQGVFELEAEINQKEKDIENLCLKLILQHQPVAADFHLISGALKMITDMERMGDGATDIAKIAMKLAEKPLIKDLVIIPKMAEETIKMVYLSINAFVNKDLKTITEVVELDDVVDNLFEEVKGELAGIISNDSSKAADAIDLLMIAKYFEKISDHAVNVSGWVGFAITGKHEHY